MTGIPEYGTGRHEDYLTWLDEQRQAGEPCSFDCGYYGSDSDDLTDHERYEHADCPKCGAKAPEVDPEGFAYSVTHRPGCPRLAPEHRYGPEDAPRNED